MFLNASQNYRVVSVVVYRKLPKWDDLPWILIEQRKTGRNFNTPTCHISTFDFIQFDGKLWEKTSPDISHFKIQTCFSKKVKVLKLVSKCKVLWCLCAYNVETMLLNNCMNDSYFERLDPKGCPPLSCKSHLYCIAWACVKCFLSIHLRLFYSLIQNLVKLDG